MSTDRPTPRPRPAADHGADPADLPAAPVNPPSARPAAAPVPTTPVPTAWTALRMTATTGATRQLGQRVSSSTYDLLGEVSQATGLSVRALLEFAVTQTYGTDEGRRLWAS